MGNWDLGLTTSQLTQTIINFSSTGDNTILAGIAGQTVRVYSLFLVVNSATNLQFKDGASTNLTGVMNMLANGSILLDMRGDPWFIASSGNAFIINQSGTAQISGRIYTTQS